MSRRTLAFALLPAIVIAGLIAAALMGRPESPAPTPPRPATAPGAAPPPPAPAPPTPPPPASLPGDPLLRRWQTSIRSRSRQGVLDCQAAFRQREDEYRAPLEAMAAEDADPRVRAFCVTTLAGFGSPPEEAFFIGRLADPSEFPRESALLALERRGTAACLVAVDRLASEDPAAAVRAAAARAAEAVRKRR